MARKGYKCKTIVLPDGSRKYIYGKSKEELEQKYIEACIQLRAGVDLKNHDTFGEFAQMWFNTFKRGDIKRNTELHYKSALNTHIMPVLAPYQMKDITPMLCSKVFSNMTAKGRKNGTQRAVRVVMAMVFNCAVDNGVIAKSPMTKQVKARGQVTEKRKALQDSEIKQLLKLVSGEAIEPFVMIGLYAGLRIGEIYGLHWDDVDMDKQEIHVCHNCHWRGAPTITNYTKTTAGFRTVPFGDDLLKVFRDLEKSRNGPLVFHGEHGEPYTQYQHRKAWRCTAQLHMGHALTPHTLRHTAITRWVAAGMDVKEVQYLAGHSNVATTLEIYSDYLAESRMDSTRTKVLSAYAAI